MDPFMAENEDGLLAALRSLSLQKLFCDASTPEVPPIQNESSYVSLPERHEFPRSAKRRRRNSLPSGFAPNLDHLSTRSLDPASISMMSVTSNASENMKALDLAGCTM
jgi:hypothetical protein